jgi:hypothetical protein
MLVPEVDVLLIETVIRLVSDVDVLLTEIVIGLVLIVVQDVEVPRLVSVVVPVVVTLVLVPLVDVVMNVP